MAIDTCKNTLLRLIRALPLPIRPGRCGEGIELPERWPKRSRRRLSGTAKPG
ncbi:hypothetical protein [Streptomyces sp. NPDC086838]|uniref:hypothetical protein n=1 Tax=Streptomyces sp. NPDC086838 TaxID=3365762 RepID=UPI00380A071A